VRVPERVVPADHDQVVEAEPGNVLQHHGCEVVDAFGRQVACGGGGEVRRQAIALHPGRVRARRVQHRPAGAVDGPRVREVERQDVFAIEIGAGRKIRESQPAATDPQHLEAELGRAIHDALDDRVQARNVTAAGEDPDAACSWHSSRSPGRC